jgi:hypothetical protein
MSVRPSTKTKQVMPLQDLMKQDSVEEAAEREVENDAPSDPWRFPHGGISLPAPPRRSSLSR